MNHPIPLDRIIYQRLHDFFATESISVQDDSHLHAGHAAHASGGKHFTVHIVSERFDGLNRIARHQLVYGVLSDLMPHPLHALVIQAQGLSDLSRGTETSYS